jgi:hypothetical protein
LTLSPDPGNGIACVFLMIANVLDNPGQDYGGIRAAVIPCVCIRAGIFLDHRELLEGLYIMIH